ncbi:MAG TPA: DapH/DapD/GlmU-related protein, partial [Halioglobus sp.]
SHLQETVIGRACSVGPYARLRPGTVLEDNVRIGNFVETKKANIGPGSKVNHLSYIGDCEMGADVNIGAGTITCNYDGANKHRTEIGNGVFVGSNSTLVAPLRIEDEGFVAAGSTVTSRVGKGDLAVSRTRQRNIHGWVRPGKQDPKD